MQSVPPDMFDIERFASFEGNTGPYILYTIVRIKSILEKYESSGQVLSAKCSFLFDLRSTLFGLFYITFFPAPTGPVNLWMSPIFFLGLKYPFRDSRRDLIKLRIKFLIILFIINKPRFYK